MIYELVINPPSDEVKSEKKLLMHFENIKFMSLQKKYISDTVDATLFTNIEYILDIDGTVINVNNLVDPPVSTPELTQAQLDLQNCYDAFKAFTP